MGYNTLNATNGNQGVGASFMNINKSGTMADITIGGYDRPYTSAGIYCSLLDTFGREIKKMYWYDNDQMKVGKVTIPARYGWYNQNGTECYNTDSIAPGQGLWTYMGGEYTVKNSGEVISGTYAVALTNGNQFVANPTPVAVKMGDVNIMGYARPYTAAGIYCSVLDTFGREIKKMYWYDNDQMKVGKVTIPARYGWYNQNGTECYNETDVVKPGEALWTYVSQDGLQMVWPSAIPTEE